MRGVLRHDSRVRKDGAENFEGISFAVIAFVASENVRAGKKVVQDEVERRGEQDRNRK